MLLQSLVVTRNQHDLQIGRGLLASLLGALGLIAGVFVLWKGIEVTYRFYDLRNQIVYLLGSAELEPDLELKKRVLVFAKGTGIICAEQDIVVQRSPSRVSLRLPYRHEIALQLAKTRVRLFSIPITVVAERRLADRLARMAVREDLYELIGARPFSYECKV